MKKVILFIILFTHCSFLSYSQTIAIQSFEQAATDTWGPIVLSTPACSSGSDHWDYMTSLSSITPSHLTQFWGIQDLNGNCGGATETITFPNVDVTVCATATLSFDYNIIGYDVSSGDNMSYELFYDNVGQGSVLLTTSTPFSTGGWSTVSVAIPGTVTNVSLVITVSQNGGSDYAGIDNVILTGTGCVACSPLTEPTNEVTAQSISNISCFSADINWTNSIDGTHALVALSTNPITGSPADATAYTANSTYGSGNTLNPNEYVVFSGISSPVNVTGLNANTTYYGTIFAYNGPIANCNENYLTGGTTFSFTTTGPVAEPTNPPTGVSSASTGCYSGTINWTIGADAANSLVVISTNPITGIPTDATAYTASSIIGVGSTIAPGEYVVYNGNGGTVNVSGLSEGFTYYVAIFSLNNGATSNCQENYLTTAVLSDFTTTSGCAAANPQISSIVYNSCVGSEPLNEIFTFTTGNTSLPIDSIEIDYPTFGVPNFCNFGCGSNTLLNNPTYVSNLNTVAGCVPDIFVFADPIPPGSQVMVFTGLNPTVVLDYSSQCGSGPVYVVFNNSASINPGRFSNTNSSPQQLALTFGGGMGDTVNYTPNTLPDTDGATVYFDPAGNPTYFISANCVYPLPIQLSYFKGETNKNFNTLYWATKTERNNDYFEIEKSTDGINFNYIGKVNGTGNSVTEKKYSFIDNNINNGTTYYRLKQIDFDGKNGYSYPIKLSINDTKIYYYNQNISINIKKQKNKIYTVNIYNLSGQLIKTTTTNGQSNINWTNKGFYIIEIPELQLRTKIISE